MCAAAHIQNGQERLHGGSLANCAHIRGYITVNSGHDSLSLLNSLTGRLLVEYDSFLTNKKSFVYIHRLIQFVCPFRLFSHRGAAVETRICRCHHSDQKRMAKKGDVPIFRRNNQGEDLHTTLSSHSAFNISSLWRTPFKPHPASDSAPISWDTFSSENLCLGAACWPSADCHHNVGYCEDGRSRNPRLEQLLQWRARGLS